MKPIRLLGLLLTCLMLVLSACSSQSTGGSSKNAVNVGGNGGSGASQQTSNASGQKSADTIKIGVLLPQSGVYADYGIGHLAGVKYIVDKINAEGGIKSLNGAKIELVVADDASDPTKAVSELRRLIDQEKVPVVLGPFSSSEAQATAPLSKQYQVPSIGIETTGVFADDYFYIVSVLAEDVGRTYADFVDWLNKKQGQNIKNIVITYPNNAYGKTNYTAAETRLKELGYNVLETIPVDPKAQDYTPTLLRVRELKPDAVISVVYTRDGQLLNEARYSLKYNDPIFIGGVGGYADKAVWDQLGDQVAKKTLANRLFLQVSMSPEVTYKPMNDLINDAKASGKTGNVELGTHFILGAQAARVLQQALEKAGTTDPKAINEAIKQVNIPYNDAYLYVPSYVNGLKYEKGAVRNTSGMMGQWTEDGDIQIVYPESYANAKPRF